MTPVSESQNYKNITATTTVWTGSGGILGIFVASTSGGVLKVSDGANTIVNSFLPTAATFYPMPARFKDSLIVTVTGAVDATVFWTN